MSNVKADVGSNSTKSGHARSFDAIRNMRSPEYKPRVQVSEDPVEQYNRLRQIEVQVYGNLKKEKTCLKAKCKALEQSVAALQKTLLERRVSYPLFQAAFEEFKAIPAAPANELEQNLEVLQHLQFFEDNSAHAFICCPFGRKTLWQLTEKKEKMENRCGLLDFKNKRLEQYKSTLEKLLNKTDSSSSSNRVAQLLALILMAMLAYYYA